MSNIYAVMYRIEVLKAALLCLETAERKRYAVSNR